MKKAAVFVTAILVLGLIYSAAVNWKMEKKTSVEQEDDRQTEDTLTDDAESSKFSLDKQPTPEEALKEHENEGEEGRKEQESSNEKNVAGKQEEINKQGKQENLQEQPQQVTGDVNVDFEGMIKEIDQKIEEQINATLPE